MEPEYANNDNGKPPRRRRRRGRRASKETEADNSSLHISDNNKIEKRLRRNDDDRISALADDVLLLILQRLDLHTAVRAGAAARRWRHLPRLLPDLDLNVCALIPHHPWRFSEDNVVAAYTHITTWFLLPPPGPETQHHYRSLRLTFYLADDDRYLHPIGDALAATTADSVHLEIRTPCTDLPKRLVAQRLTSFIAARPAAFAGLTSLSLHSMAFSSTSINIAGILDTCHRLELLSLDNCTAYAIMIDAPHSSLLALEIHSCSIDKVELTRVPKLERLVWDDTLSVRSILFGSVPRLSAITLSGRMHLQPYIENPAMLSPTFSSLRDVRLCNFMVLHMPWILFLLQAAPLLNKLSIKMYPTWPNGGLYRSCTAVETPKFEHRNLTSLEIKVHRISDDTKIKHYIGLIKECAVCLKTTRLLEQCGYWYDCDGVTCRCQVRESY